jgi:hypothetical protein
MIAYDIDMYRTNHELQISGLMVYARLSDTQEKIKSCILFQPLIVLFAFVDMEELSWLCILR